MSLFHRQPVELEADRLVQPVAELVGVPPVRYVTDDGEVEVVAGGDEIGVWPHIIFTDAEVALDSKFAQSGLLLRLAQYRIRGHFIRPHRSGGNLDTGLVEGLVVGMPEDKEVVVTNDIGDHFLGTIHAADNTKAITLTPRRTPTAPLSTTIATASPIAIAVLQSRGEGELLVG